MVGKQITGLTVEGYKSFGKSNTCRFVLLPFWREPIVPGKAV